MIYVHKKGKKGPIIASTTMSVGLEGMKGKRVWLEANVRFGKEQIVVVGLPDASIKESKERILSSIHAKLIWIARTIADLTDERFISDDALQEAVDWKRITSLHHSQGKVVNHSG